MKGRRAFWSATLLGVTTLCGSAGAATLDFEGMSVGAYYGKTNVNDPALGCVGFFNCYEEDGLLVGTPNDPAAPFAHVHRHVGLSRAAQYHGDSAGIYVRAADLSAFNLESLEVTEIAGSKGPNFTIVAFSEPFNTDIVGGTAPFASQVASASISASGVRTFGDAFAGIKAFWIHYDGYTATPSDGTDWSLVVDNIQVSAVPVPAAAWLLGSALLGGTVLGRRRRA